MAQGQRSMNATYLFEGTYGRVWPPSSESFWTAIFGMFLLHLGAGPVPQGQLTVWQCSDGGNKKWYSKRLSKPILELTDLDFESIVIEPRALWKPWPETSFDLPTAVGCFSPDIVMRSRGQEGTQHFTIIENKITTGACFADNQLENYSHLAKWLREHDIAFDILLLQSVGCCETLYNQALATSEWSMGFELWVIVVGRSITGNGSYSVYATGTTHREMESIYLRHRFGLLERAGVSRSCSIV